jgi:signal transduction histidine kinase
MSSNADQTADLAALQADLAARDREIIALSQELDETNRGVVALYAELDDKAAALREATELKSRFLNYMSHEFKTPLSAVRSMIRILLDRMDGPLTDEQAKQLEFINGSVVELTEMVNDLLDLARIEAGRVAISAEWFEMVDLFAALRGMFKPLLSESSVALILEEPVHVPRIFTDDKKLSRPGSRLCQSPRRRSRQVRGRRHRHRHRTRIPRRHFPGFHAGRFRTAKEMARNGPRLVALQTTCPTTRRRGRHDQRTKSRLHILGDDSNPLQ